MAGVSGCLKYSMFIFNFLFWLCGVLILALAIWVRVGQKHEIIAGDTHAYSHVPANILIVVGSIVMILGFLGCCGAIKESRCLLLLFFIGLLLILLLQVAAGIVGTVYKSECKRILNETLYEDVKLLSQTDDAAVKYQTAIAKFEKEFKCCGLINGAADWGNNFNNYYESCECTDTSNSSCTNYEGKSVYKQTCVSLIKEYVEKYFIVLIGIAFGLAIMEVLGMIFSMVLFCQIGEK